MTIYSGVVKVYGDEDRRRYFSYLQINDLYKTWEKKEFKQFEEIIDFINQSLPLSENILRKIINIKKPLTERELNNLESNCDDYHI